MRKIILLLFFINVMHSQSIKVSFLFKKNDVALDNMSLTKKFTLYQNESYSLFEVTDFMDINNFKYKDKVAVIKERDTIAFYTIDNAALTFSYNEQFYKDFRSGVLLSSELLEFKRKVFIEDKIDMFEWEILNEKDTIIANYKCKKATTKHRGREYEAYFTNEIANQGGPWKFDGLPGFILYVKTKDNFLEIQATEITYLDSVEDKLKNPFINKKRIPFSALAGEIIKEEKIRFQKAKSSETPSQSMIFGPRMGTIELIEELQKERVYD
ncbi:GLPGLI family protein [Flavobacterium sp.]|uniref:GLPGLI family protein n=1 Tax=Flavobacterium sp. TaxID=239 RepID=UPI002628F87B|nr:GLPGLI family protein [Flavobacterium sp.]MDG2432698.1 GLPGLI family protein [Flavobacterium sp.]